MAIRAALGTALVWAAVFGTQSPAAPKPSFGRQYYLYVGDYTGPKSRGIYAFRYDTQSVSFEPLGMVGEMVRPSFLAVHPNGRFLYAVSELGNDGRTNGFVYSFSIDRATGKLTFLNRQSSGGGGACHLVVDKTAQTLLVSNYGSGSAAAFPLLADGSIGPSSAFIQFQGSGPDATRQRGPHAHAVVLSPDNRFLLVPDLGMDRIHLLRFDPAKSSLTISDPPSASITPGSGPRHAVFAPNGRFVYVLSEMGSTVTAFRYEGVAGRLTAFQTISTLPDGFSGVNNSAEIGIDASGGFLYASNRGNDSLAVFSVSKETGDLTRVQISPTLGRTPRNFAIDPTGRYLLAANQDSDTIVLFQIDRKTGQLTATGKTLDTPAPVCLTFVPAS